MLALFANLELENVQKCPWIDAKMVVHRRLVGWVASRNKQ